MRTRPPGFWAHVITICGMMLMALGLPGVLLAWFGGLLIDWGDEL